MFTIIQQTIKPIADIRKRLHWRGTGLYEYQTTYY